MSKGIRELTNRELTSLGTKDPFGESFGGGFGTGFGGGLGNGFGGFDLDNFIDKPQNEMQKQLIVEEELDLKKKVPALSKFPTFDEFLKGQNLPDVPGLELPKNIEEIRNSDEKQEDLTKQVEEFLANKNKEMDAISGVEIKDYKMDPQLVGASKEDEGDEEDEEEA